jgi:hypothetical protein
MKRARNQVRVFIASPGDVAAERDQLSKVVGEINLTISAIAPEKGIILELIRWETHVHPGMGVDAQDVVNQQITEYDIFVGIMWKRFGTPTERAESGTEEEFLKAYSSWQEHKRLPVLFYFCQAPFPPPRSAEEIKQLARLVEFREELSQKGLVWEYSDRSTFPDVIRPHLILVLSRMFSQQDSLEAAATETMKSATSNDLITVRNRVKALAKEYETLRTTFPSGNERTRKMTVVESKMRSESLSTYPILSELVHSASPGERLAAVATLKEIPTASYLTWLADRVGVEKPFIGYHATLALLHAARKMGEPHRNAVRTALRRAKGTLENLNYQDPNQVRVLNDAQREIE